MEVPCQSLSKNRVLRREYPQRHWLTQGIPRRKVFRGPDNYYQFVMFVYYMFDACAVFAQAVAWAGGGDVASQALLSARARYRPGLFPARTARSIGRM